MIGKVKLFIMSFWIFFLLLIIVTLDFPLCFKSECSFIGFDRLLSINNLIALGGFIFLLLGAFFYYQFMKELKGDCKPMTVDKVENINYEYFALLMTIISLISFDFTTIRGLILLIVLVLIMGAIFVKTELFYSNPSFALLGFHIYKIDSEKESLNGGIIITKHKINDGDKVKYIKISEKVLFVKKA